MWELTWANINMLLATIPDYKSTSKPDESGRDEEETDVVPEDLKNFLKM
jgi:hypothetical protein